MLRRVSCGAVNTTCVLLLLLLLVVGTKPLLPLPLCLEPLAEPPPPPAAAAVGWSCLLLLLLVQANTPWRGNTRTSVARPLSAALTSPSTCCSSALLLTTSPTC
jgi:hypothetical protein